MKVKLDEVRVGQKFRLFDKVFVRKGYDDLGFVPCLCIDGGSYIGSLLYFDVRRVVEVL